MSGFLGNLVENFVEKKFQGGNNQSGYATETTETYSSSYNNNSQGPPQVPYPWRSRWSSNDNCYVFENQETSEQVWEYEEVIRRTQQRGQSSQTYYEEEQSGRSGGGHGMLYGGLGAAAGLAAGAGMMYEGEKIHNDYDNDKYRVENDYENDKYCVENDVENFPENAAQWTGQKVGEVEAVPQDIEYGVDRFDNRVEQDFDNGVTDVVDAPEEVAGWFGNKVGDVERFDDNVDNAYDEGRYEGRNDRY